MKIILALTLVIVSAFLTHHFFITRLSHTENREVAAFSERNNAQQIQWEHQIAEELAQQKTEVQVAVRPNWRDQLAYEFFMGQYDISLNGGQIQKISLQKSMTGVSFTSGQFIEKFGHQLKDFSTYKTTQSNSQTEVINLYDKAGAASGSFQITRDENGKVVEFLIN